MLRYPLPSNKSFFMSDHILGDPVKPSQAGPSGTGGPTWPGDIGPPPGDLDFNKEAGHFMEEICRKKVLEIIEDHGLHNQREDLFSWVDKFELQSKEDARKKGKGIEPGN